MGPSFTGKLPKITTAAIIHHTRAGRAAGFPAR
jgi:hypothetical protein